MNVPSSATLVLGEEKDVDRWLDADDWYALVFEIAALLKQGVALKEYESLHYAGAMAERIRNRQWLMR